MLQQQDMAESGDALSLTISSFYPTIILYKVKRLACPSASNVHSHGIRSSSFPLCTFKDFLVLEIDR